MNHSDPSYNPLAIIPYQSNSENPSRNPSHFFAQSHLQPPSADPYGSLYSYYPDESAAESQKTYFQPQDSVSQSWVINQPEPLQYSYHAQNYIINNSGISTTSNNMCNDGSWMSEMNDASKNKLNQTKASQPMPCEICKINCNSKDVFQKHILGKKHKRNLHAYTMPIATADQSVVAGTMNGQIVAANSYVANTPELEAKKYKLMNGGTPVDSVRVCTRCNVVCNSQDVFSKHLTGKRHALQGAASLGVSQPLIDAALRPLKYTKTPKKPKVVQSAWCDVCKLTCSNIDIYGQHVAGKKHQKNMESLVKSKQVSNNDPPILMIGPTEKPGGSAVKKKAATQEDLETKKRKMVVGGTAMGAVRVCALCNVVCNSETVLSTHLSGQKHLAMVRQSETGTGAAS